MRSVGWGDRLAQRRKGAKILVMIRSGARFSVGAFFAPWRLCASSLEARSLMLRAVMILAIVLAGCDASPSAPREPAECRRIGDRCELPGGPIGICSESTAPCDEPPCLACMSQH